MQRSITKSEVRMEQMMDQKIQVIHKRLDAFELRVLHRPAPTIDVTTFQRELSSLYADIIALLAPTESKPEYALAVPKDEVVMTILFGDTMQPPDSSRATGKCHRSDHTSGVDEARQMKKKARQQLEVTQRKSILNEERRQQQARDLDIGLSSIPSTTDGAPIVGDDVTDGVPIIDPRGSEKSDPPAS
ncbi:hypothetical protein R3W88_019434 [Solanum pinnatisectum]|uniref:Integrase core domain containing protein n=1 Tax=Solanum pinnatisectum TaxID=50273 RepID=A0AAV9KJI0_9SOLN|nr:hypothetical protein R3W88_019434 [Solanum pinnatisectum]